MYGDAHQEKLGTAWRSDVSVPQFHGDSTLTLVGELVSLEAWRQIFGTTYQVKSFELYGWSLSLSYQG